jgi:hypothetical protein
MFSSLASRLTGVVAATLIAASACGPAPEKTGRTSAPARQAPEPEKVRAVPLDCGEGSPAATFTPATRRHPNLIIVTFRGAQPGAEDVERALRRCLEAVASTKRVTSEVQATAWHTASGSDEDYKTLTVPDGSSQLLYQPEGGRILSWKERWPAPR